MINGRGFLIKDEIKDYTKLQGDPHVPCQGSMYKANIDSMSYRENLPQILQKQMDKMENEIFYRVSDATVKASISGVDSLTLPQRKRLRKRLWVCLWPYTCCFFVGNKGIQSLYHKHPYSQLRPSKYRRIQDCRGPHQVRREIWERHVPSQSGGGHDQHQGFLPQNMRKKQSTDKQ